MLVKDFMSTKLITAEKDLKIFDAVELMKQHDIHRLPVVDNNRLIGLITEGTIQAAMPSKATSLSVYEVNYLLNKTSVADIMIKKVETIREACLLEDAIYQMRSNNINVLPVLDESNGLIGIITNNDIFDAFLDVTGYKEKGTRVSILIPHDEEGVLAKLTSIFSSEHYNIVQIVVYRHEKQPTIVIQTTSDKSKEIQSVLKEHGYDVLSSIKTVTRN